jgi:GT2 family glycosyltransferase
MARPTVTVLIDTFNHERFIEEAIVSVLEQDYPSSETEVIVVDDGSTDRTPEIARKFEPRIRFIRKPNGGQASAFNAGIPEAHGEIVAFLDGDDWWAPEKLARVVEAMKLDLGLGIVGHGIVMVHIDGREQTEILRDGFRFRADMIEGARLFRRRGSFLGTSRLTIRADLLRRIGPVPEGLTVQADEYLFTLAAVLAGVQILPEALAYYRLHQANAFHMTKSDPQRLRRKQQVLAELARCLEQQLAARGLKDAVVRMLTERMQADAIQLRLMLDGGHPWETVQAERTLYEVLHPEATAWQRAFKALTLVPAYVMPPRLFYKAKQRVASSPLYLRARKRWLPIPEMPHLQKDWSSTP